MWLLAAGWLAGKPQLQRIFAVCAVEVAAPMCRLI